MRHITCQYCASGCCKAGKQSNGIQKLRCKRCGKYQLETYCNKDWRKSIKENILKIYLKNVAIRDIAKLLQVSVNTVMAEIKKYKNYQPVLNFRPNEEYEIDEIRTYVKRKKRLRWIAYAIEKKSREVIALSVGRRTTQTIQKVVDTVLRLTPKKIYTDGLQHYRQLIPTAIHKVKRHHIQLIERKNLTARGKLRRLNRKTIAYSRNDAMLLASVKLLFWKKQEDALVL